MPVSPGRAVAFDILLRVEREDSYASELLHSSRCADLSQADHGLATELVMGVLRWRAAIDATLAPASSMPLTKLDPEVRAALRLGAYQLGWLSRIPAHAAIHESVELVKRARKRSAAPFVNAILRRLSTNPIAFSAGAIEQSASAEALAAAASHPEWLVRRWIEQFGLATARAICVYDQAVPSTAIRLRDASVETDLTTHQVDLAPGAFLTCARRVMHGDVTRTPEFTQGRIAIQDEASQLVAALVGTGSRILDACAAPGGKTWSMADRNPQATVTAVELHRHRADLLRRRVASPSVTVINSDLCALPLTEPFDRVLVDAPCSGTGTLARNPEIKWRLRPEDLAGLQSRQRAILQAAMRHVAPGGHLIYSTCSLEREENERVVEQALAGSRTFHRLDCAVELGRLQREGELRAPIESLTNGPYLRTIPGLQRCDGFFGAILQKD